MQDQPHPQLKPQRKLSHSSAKIWLELMTTLRGSVDPKNDQKDFRNPQALTLEVDNWSKGRYVTFPEGADICFPNQRNGINPSTGKPVRGTGYVLVTVDDGHARNIYVLKEKDGVVSFECRPQPSTGHRYASSVGFPPTLA